MVFSWFNAAQAKSFGQELAGFYIARAGKLRQGTRDKVAERKQRELLQKLSQQIEQFKSSQSLNFYKKAQAGNAFKWHLLEADFDPAHVDELTSWVTRQL